MLAAPKVPRNAEGRKVKAALVEDGPIQRGQQYKHYKGRSPRKPRPCGCQSPARAEGGKAPTGLWTTESNTPAIKRC